jgi:hypothetical protein
MSINPFKSALRTNGIIDGKTSIKTATKERVCHTEAVYPVILCTKMSELSENPEN